MNLNQVTLPACDIAASSAFYEAMGFRKIVADEHYARFECPQGDSTFSIEHVEHASQSPGVVIYFEVDDLQQTYEQLFAQGFSFDQKPADQTWLWSEARLKDPYGNAICLYKAGRNRKYPPWRIEQA